MIFYLTQRIIPDLGTPNCYVFLDGFLVQRVELWPGATIIIVSSIDCVK